MNAAVTFQIGLNESARAIRGKFTFAGAWESCCRMRTEVIGNNNIRRMIWPANSPDLNPIEHVWDELGRWVYRDNAPHNINELRQRLVQEWNNIPQNTIRRCISNMRKRCNACLAANGGFTRY